MKTGSLTDIGEKREINQDYFYVSAEQIGPLQNLFLVADGMGGHNAGEVASRLAVESIVKSIQKGGKQDAVAILLDSVREANRAVKGYADQHPDKKGMGTTVVAATIEGNSLTVLNVGDSRLYVVGDVMNQLTKDHSLVQEMVRMGEMDAERAKNHPDKNIITRAVGVEAEVEPDVFEEVLLPGQKLLLCTDGLTNMVDEKMILDVLHEDITPEQKAEELVELANENGGKDNITLIIVEPEII